MPDRITSLTNPRVKQVVKLRDRRGRKQTGLFVAEGLREVERALAAGLVCVDGYVCEALLQETQALPKFNLLKFDVTVTEVSADVFRKMAYVREPEGVLAVFEQRVWSPSDVLNEASTGQVWLVAVGTEKPGNLGAMVRTAAAAGCCGVIAAGADVDIYNPNAIRSSTAAVFSLPTLVMPEADAIDWLLKNQIRIMAATLEESTDYRQAELSASPIAITIGPEAAGLSPAWLTAANQSGGQRIRIPMRSPGDTPDSLNAANAAAILLYEATRHRD